MQDALRLPCLAGCSVNVPHFRAQLVRLPPEHGNARGLLPPQGRSHSFSDSSCGEAVLLCLRLHRSSHCRSLDIFPQLPGGRGWRTRRGEVTSRM
jgi:hypothetical protein